MITKIIALGCSITEQVGWAAYLSECMSLPLVNLAVSSGSNQLQQKRIQEYIFKNDIAPDDIVVWQITATNRSQARLVADHHNLQLAKEDAKGCDYSPSIVSSKNIFDGKDRIDFLSHSNYALQSRTVIDDSIEPQLLEDLLFYLIAISKMTSNLLVVFGWDTVLSADYISKFKQELDLHKINYVIPTIVSYCHTYKLAFNGDTTHPTNGSSRIYARDVLIPKLNKMINTNIPTLPIGIH